MGKGKKALKTEQIDDTEALACAGRSILDMMKDRLDEDIDELMSFDSDAKKKTVEAVKNHAAGMADAIAIIEKPYNPDTEIVRNDAMLRYEERSGVKEEG